MRRRIAQIEIDSPAHDVIHDHVLARRAKSQRALVFENVTGILKFFQVTLIKFCAFALQIRAKLATNMRPFVPIQAEPSQTFVNGGHCFLGITLHVSVFNAQHEFASVMPCKEPVEQCSARAANVEITSRRRSKTNADLRTHLAKDYTDFCRCCSRFAVRSPRCAFPSGKQCVSHRRGYSLFDENFPSTAPCVSIFRKIHFCDSSVTVGQRPNALDRIESNV